jgi:hypothetical protein
MDPEPQDSFEHDLPTNTTLSFIVKIWIEELASDQHPALWRGYITHVPSQQRRYIQDLYEIVRFIAPNLVALGVATQTNRWRVRRRGPSRHKE